MSEHPELRETMARRIALSIDGHLDDWRAFLPIADDLLALPAGPVGKLQAENEALRKQVDKFNGVGIRFVKLAPPEDDDLDIPVFTGTTNQLADPERIRREAIGARALDIAAKARPDSVAAYPLIDAWADLRAAVATLDAGEPAGE